MKKPYIFILICGIYLCVTQALGQSCNNYTYGGKVFQNADPAVANYCNTLTLLPMTEVESPTGGSGGGPEYQWQVSFNQGNSWVDIAIAEGSQRDLFANTNPVFNYLIGIGLDVTQTTIFRRGVKRPNCASFVYSNWVLFKVFQQVSDPGNFKNLIIQCEINGNNFCTPAFSTQQLDQYIDPNIAYLPSGGTAPYEYLWQISDDDFNWSFYSVEALPDLCFTPGVRRFFRRGVRPLGSPCNYIYSNSIEIRNVMELVISFNITHPECSDENTGVIEVFDLSGNDNFILSTFQYSIDNGATWQPSNVFSNLPAGNYSITIDSKCACDNPNTSECTGIANIIATPAPEFINVTHSDLTDCGANDGTISIAASGGIGPLLYSIDGFTWSTNPNFTNLPIGNYLIFVKNTDDSCERYYGTINLTEPPAPNITQISTVDLTDCNSEDGQMTITASGDFGNFEYTIDGGNSWTTNSTFLNLSKSTYVAGVRNIDGTCAVFQNTVIDGPTPPTILSIDNQQPSNCGINDGIISINANAGSDFSLFSIDGGSSWQASGSFSNLAPGNYSIAVRNANGTCIVFEPNSVQFDYPLAPTILNVVSTQPSDCGANDGMIDIQMAIPQNNYLFSIDGGQNWQSEAIFSNLSGGLYQLVITNPDGTCLINYGTIQLTNPSSPQIDFIEPTPPSNCGSQDGTITIHASGGIGIFQYSINGGNTWSTSATFSDLPAGSYFIMVRNNDETCKVSNASTLLLEDPLAVDIIDIESNSPTDCGLSNGTINIIIDDNPADYEFTIDNGETWINSNLFNNLFAGNYWIGVRRLGGNCETILSTPIILETPPTPVLINVDVVQPSDCEVNNGTIQIFASGGIGSYEYTIDGGNNWFANNLFQNLSPGTYSLQVRNINGTCPVAYTNLIQLEYPTTPIINEINTIPLSDCGASDGSITIEAFSGIPPLQYSINGGISWSENPTFEGLASGIYDIIVSNADGSCATYSPNDILLEEVPSPQIIDVLLTNPIGCGTDNGSIDFVVSGGTGSFLFSIDGGNLWQSDSTFSNLSGGSYSLSVQNANGTCLVEYGAVQLLGAVAPMVANVITLSPSDCYTSDGSITIEGTGGSNTYQYSIDGGQNWQASPIFNDLPLGVYQVGIRNADGTCPGDFGSVTLGSTGVPSITGVVINNPTDCGGSDGNISIEAIAAGQDLLYSIDNGLTWSDTAVFTNLSAAVYQILISNVDNSCPVAWNEPIILTDPLLASFDTVILTNPSSCQQADGLIVASLTGGENGFEFSIDQGQTWQSDPVFTGISGGNYILTARNQDGNCISQYPQTITLLHPSELADLTPAIIAPSACGSNDGSITINYSGDNLMYSIDGGANWQSENLFPLLAPNSYTLMVSGPNLNCTLIHEFPVIIEAPTTAVSLEVESTNPTECHEDAGTIVIHPPDSTSYLFSIDEGGSFQLSNSFTSLTSGTYVPLLMNIDSSCIYSSADTIVLMTLPNPEIIQVQTDDPQGCDTANGSITVHAIGLNTIEYSIDMGQTWHTNDGAFEQLLPGDYTVWIRNEGSNCIVMYPTLIDLSAVNNGQVEVDFNATICQGDTYQIGDNEYTETGEYHTILIGENGCDSILNLVLTVNDTFQIAVHENICPGQFVIVGMDTINTPGFHEIDLVTSSGCDSTVIVNLDIIPSDTTLLEQTLCSGEIFVIDDSTFTLPGDYYLSSINEFGCNDVLHLSLTNLPLPTFDSLTLLPPESCGTMDGAIIFWGLPSSIEISLDSGITWQAEAQLNGLNAGVYPIQLLDTNTGCIQDTTIELVGLDQPQILSIDTIAPTSCGTENGAITILPVSDQPMLYSIDGGQNWQSQNHFPNLGIGIYQILMGSPSLTCFSDTLSINLSAPVNFSIHLQDSISPTCTNALDGSITVEVLGEGNYNFLWNNGSVQPSIFGLGSGWYELTVTDQYGCMDSLAIGLSNPPPFMVELPEKELFLCPGQTINYEIPEMENHFEWNNGFTTLAQDEDLVISNSGVYYFLAENASGCQFEDSIEVIPLEAFFSPRFLLPSEGLIGESVFGIEVSWPAPDSIQWIVDGNQIEIIDTFLNQIELQFLSDGDFTIGLELHLGDCTILLEKEITIYEDPGQIGSHTGNGFSEILEYVLYPNPNTGQFEIQVVLDQPIPLQIRIYRDNGVLLESRFLEGTATYLEAFNLSNAPPGNYIAQIQTATEWRTINFIMH